MKNLKQIGRILTKKELVTVIGGICKACVTIPGSGPMDDEQKRECKACQKKHKNDYIN